VDAVTGLAIKQQTDVLASAVGGDEYAFGRIVVAHHEDMRRVCLAISGDQAVAEEAVQAAWFVAWKKLGRVSDPSHLRPWLVSIAVNEARHLLRSRRRRSWVEVPEDLLSGDAGGGDPASGIALVDLWAALGRMHPDDRALLAMRYGAGFNATELAIATGRSPAAVRQRLKRLVDRLREELRDG
jgi:RNA polymerase sigma-70 factor (ECF subfamily)